MTYVFHGTLNLAQLLRLAPALIITVSFVKLALEFGLLSSTAQKLNSESLVLACLLHAFSSIYLSVLCTFLCRRKVDVYCTVGHALILPWCWPVATYLKGKVM